jgi:hypothetical protein
MKFNLKKTLLYSFVFGLISIIVTYIFIYNYYKKSVSESELYEIVLKISSTDSISSDFIKVYCEVNNIDVSNSTNNFLFSLPYNKLIGNYSERCPCLDANYGLLVWNSLERISLGIQLDNKIGSKKCLDYYLTNIAFPNNVIGVNVASRVIYNKELHELNNVEMIELSMISRNPSFYNKKKRPDLVKARLNELLKRIDYKN